jgi:MinD-like ATPase involved in chromosome partitioning or flagellar assembly/CheY-like chemotaxis protein
VSQVIKVLLIEDNRIEARQTQHWLTGQGLFEVECVDNLKDGLDCISEGGIDIVLLDLNLPDSRGEATFDKLYAEFPEVPIVVLTGEYDDSIGPDTVAKGAQDYLVKQQADGASLSRVLRFALTRNRAQQEKFKELQYAKTGHVIGFIGAKGGVGTTTTALNVATALATQGKSVILAEIRPSFGTLVFHVPLQPTKNLRTLLKLPVDRIGLHELNAVLCKGPSGLRILFGPQEHEDDFQEIDPVQVEAIIKGLGQLAEYIILDLPSQPSTATRAVANLCQFACVVTEREPGSVQAGQLVVKQLNVWGSQGNHASVVLVGSVVVNRTIYANYLMPTSEVQSQMGCETIGHIPWGATENLQALKEGVPLVLLQPDSDATLSYIELATHLASIDQRKPAQRR